MQINDYTTVTVRLGGEGGTSFAVDGWRGITLAQAAGALQHVTGYKASFLVDELETRLRRSELGVTELKTSCSGLCPVRFLVSVDERVERPMSASSAAEVKARLGREALAGPLDADERDRIERELVEVSTCSCGEQATYVDAAGRGYCTEHLPTGCFHCLERIAGRSRSACPSHGDEWPVGRRPGAQR